MKIEEIKTIVKLMSDHDLTEFKIEAEEYNLCIRRGGSVPAQIVTQVAPAVPAVAAMPAPAATQAAAPAVAAAEVAAAPAETIDSPLVGTFYRASSPEAQPFVKVGDKVTPDTVVGIIEAMKVMNEIKAEKSGVIKEIAVENGQPVEYGETLFVIG
ncbi:acetyl-CoA carboxylase biotin carboxyl carrier protein [uncultured Victivallis sp.]|uniref:acetyl-CoA carboxylase biotin carboxyl carrier protein n=1 Tax=uncultured Victivallis sp. TaxID=354118 RepID=UPI0025EB1080|nr:acetyl-CoA carboxylase biotin carboxyl carrier protein [uncultured Victivallis sp.]